MNVWCERGRRIGKLCDDLCHFCLPVCSGIDRSFKAPADAAAVRGFCGGGRRCSFSGPEPGGRCGGEWGHLGGVGCSGAAGGGRPVSSEFSAVKCRKKEGPLAVSKLTFPDKYDMLIVWISLWITETSLCIIHGYPPCPKEFELLLR